MNASDTLRLLELVTRKHDCLVQLRELGRTQAALIDSGDVNRLLGVLADKQRLLVDLHDLERFLDPYRHDDPERRTWAGEQERLRCARLADDADRLLAEVLTGEKRCEDALRRRRDETAVQLAAVQSAGAARDAYRSTTSYSTSTLDLNSDS